jgi:hypothetical protein
MSETTQSKTKASHLGKRKSPSVGATQGYEPATKSQKVTEGHQKMAVAAASKSSSQENLDKVQKDKFDLEGNPDDDENVKWRTLEHHGVR